MTDTRNLYEIIARLEEENEKLRAVVRAAKEHRCEFYSDDLDLMKALDELSGISGELGASEGE